MAKISIRYSLQRNNINTFCQLLHIGKNFLCLLIADNSPANIKVGLEQLTALPCQTRLFIAYVESSEEQLSFAHNLLHNLNLREITLELSDNAHKLLLETTNNFLVVNFSHFLVKKKTIEETK